MSNDRTDMMPLWTDALMGDTFHLSTEAFGAYMRLLILSWRQKTGDIPDCDLFCKNALGWTPRKWASIKPEIEHFFTTENGRWVQKRLKAEWVRAQDRAEGRVLSKQAKGSQKTQPKLPKKPNDSIRARDRALAGAGAGETDLTDSSDEESVGQSGKSDRPTDVSFDEFWFSYPHDGPSHRGKAYEAWAALDEGDRVAALAAAKALDTPPRGLFAWTWLEQREWTAKAGNAAPVLSPRPDDPVAAELFDALAADGRIAAFTAWLAPERVTYRGRMLHPPNGFMAAQIAQRFGPLLRQHGVAIGEVLAANDDERKTA